MLRGILLFVALFVLSITYLHSQDTNSVRPTVSKENIFSPEAYVIFDEDTLFPITTSFGAYTPSDRAKTITERLESIADGLFQVEDSFNIVEITNYSVIRYKDLMIMSVSDKEAAFMNLTRQEAALYFQNRIETAFINSIEKHTLMEWALRIGYTLLTLAGLFLIFFLINRLFRWVNLKLIDYEKGLKRKRKSFYRYLAPKGPEYFFTFLLRILKWAIIIIILFLYLPLIFGFLPWTKGIVEQFYGWITDPILQILSGIRDFLPNLFFIIIIIIFTRYVVRILNYVSGEIEMGKLKLKGFHGDWAKPTLNIVKIIVYVFALVFMFPYLPGSDSPAFQGISIFLGVLLSLGSTSAIANIVAGIVITYMRPFMIGDRVKIGETIGDVVEKTLLVTKIRTTKNEDVTIPNATIINTHLWNYTKNAKELGIILHPTVTIGYDVPSEKVIELLLAAAKDTKNLTREFKPFVLQKSLNDFYVEYELNVYTKQPGKMPLFYSELNQSIQRAFNQAGVEILSPHYNAIRDGNASTIPDEGADIRNPVEKVIDKVTGKDSQ